MYQMRDYVKHAADATHGLPRWHKLISTGVDAHGQPRREIIGRRGWAEEYLTLAGKVHEIHVIKILLLKYYCNVI